MSYSERYSAGALTRPLAVLGALALLLSLIPFAGTALAQDDPPGSRGVDEACAHVDVSAGGDNDFPDIANLGSEEAREAIRCTAAYEISIGYMDGTYRPTLDIQRYQMALFLIRFASYVEETTDFELPAPEDQGFTDIDRLPEEQQDAINQLGEMAVTTGTSATTFSPHRDVTRRDMASFIVRLQDEIADQLDDDDARYETDASYFPDVPDDMPRSGDVNAITSVGIAQGFQDGTYGPFTPVRRAEMALFIMRYVDENVAAGRIPALGAPVLTEFSVALSPEAEVDPDDDQATPIWGYGDDGASGAADVTITEDGEVSFEMSAEDLTSAPIEVAGTPFHIHEGDVDENGPVVVVLGEGDDFDYADGDVSGAGEGVAVEGFDVDDIVDNPGDYYLNFHTEDHPAGALRGQLPAGDTDFLPADPVFESIDTAPGVADVTLNFNVDVFDGGDELAPTDFIVLVDAVPQLVDGVDAAVDSRNADDSVTLTLDDALAGGDFVSVRLLETGAAKLENNLGVNPAAQTRTATVDVDEDAPTFDSLSAVEGGTELALHFSEPVHTGGENLSSSAAAAEDVRVVVNGERESVDGGDIDGITAGDATDTIVVSLDLDAGETVGEGDDISVTLDEGLQDSGEEPYIRDVAGNVLEGARTQTATFVAADTGMSDATASDLDVDDTVQVYEVTVDGDLEAGNSIVILNEDGADFGAESEATVVHGDDESVDTSTDRVSADQLDVTLDDDVDDGTGLEITVDDVSAGPVTEAGDDPYEVVFQRSEQGTTTAAEFVVYESELSDVTLEADFETAPASDAGGDEGEVTFTATLWDQFDEEMTVDANEELALEVENTGDAVVVSSDTDDVEPGESEDGTVIVAAGESTTTFTLNAEAETSATATLSTDDADGDEISDSASTSWVDVDVYVGTSEGDHVGPVLLYNVERDDEGVAGDGWYLLDTAIGSVYVEFHVTSDTYRVLGNTATQQQFADGLDVGTTVAIDGRTHEIR